MKLITVIILISSFLGTFSGIGAVRAESFNAIGVNSVVDDSFTDPVPFDSPSPQPWPLPLPAPCPDPVPLPDIVESVEVA